MYMNNIVMHNEVGYSVKSIVDVYMYLYTKQMFYMELCELDTGNIEK